MVDLSVEQCALYASCLVLGIFTGYKLKRPLQVISTLAFKEQTKLVLVVRDDLKMSKGKVIAQCCHGALSSYIKATESHSAPLRHWVMSGQAKVVVKANSLEELLNLKKEADELGVPSSLIRDAGRTQLEPGTETVLAVGPDVISNINRITGHLKLL